MLLRSISKHVKDQNWFAVALDFFIVVFGVFIGFQVQQWNEEQGNVRLERQYIERLLTDVNNSIDRTTASRKHVLRLNAESKFILKALQTCQLPTDQRDAFAKAIYDVGRIGPTNYTTGTINEMLASGAFSLLRNTELRDILNDIISEAENDRSIFPSILDQVNKHYLQLYEEVVFIGNDDVFTSADVSWKSMEIDFENMCQNQLTHSAVAGFRMRGLETIYFYDRALQVLNRAKLALESELSLNS